MSNDGIFDDFQVSRELAPVFTLEIKGGVTVLYHSFDVHGVKYGLDFVLSESHLENVYRCILHTDTLTVNI